ncbi:MAG: helix-turn-helix transcriptional regulator [Clostridia bacterium]|nr:helix-turn-helix transcriptional regulator [Clostridia bacterium]
MRRKRKMNVVSVWIIVIFTIIAVTLITMFMLTYQSILKTEVRTALREQVEVLRDNADLQVVDVIENQIARRLASKDISTGYIQAIAEGHMPSSTEILDLTAYCAEVRVSISDCERVELYFPANQLVIGSQGVQFLTDSKYQSHASGLDYLRVHYPADQQWLKRKVITSGTSEERNQVIYLRMYPGVYPAGKNPMLAVTFNENELVTLMQDSLRSLNSDDYLLLADKDGVVWCTDSDHAALLGTQLPQSGLADGMVELADGSRAMLVEAATSLGPWYYTLISPSALQVGGYNRLVTVWAALCVVMLLCGLALVLRVMMKHYHEPIQRLVENLPQSPDKANQPKGRGLSSPGDHLLLLETALSDMNKLKEEQVQFTTHNKPVLRQSWLNCFIHGEAHYSAPLTQLDIEFPYPHFQVVVCSETPTDEQIEIVRSIFHHQPWVMEAFESREKETVLLFNHAFEQDALPLMLEQAGMAFDEMGSALVFGVGILTQDDELVAASFRCARRALSSRYFEKDSRVCVFDPSVRHGEAESTLTQIIAQLMELTGLIRRSTQEDVDHAIDTIVTQLRETMPYLNTMRSIMLIAAMFLSKVVYDMKASPEDVYGENMLNAYYHINDISEFAQRLKQDSRLLRTYLTQATSAGNRSVIQYAIHHIRNSAPAELAIHTIAEAIGISTGHLSRMFHQETGRKLVDYLQEVRMEHAARLLAEGTLSNEEICERIGYSRLQYFASKFKEHYGLTLNEYRLKSQYSAGEETQE